MKIIEKKTPLRYAVSIAAKTNFVLNIKMIQLKRPILFIRGFSKNLDKTHEKKVSIFLKIQENRKATVWEIFSILNKSPLPVRVNRFIVKIFRTIK